MALENVDIEVNRSLLMRKFLKRIVDNDLRAKQLFRLYYDRGEISEEQFYRSIRKYQ